MRAAREIQTPSSPPDRVSIPTHNSFSPLATDEEEEENRAGMPFRDSSNTAKTPRPDTWRYQPSLPSHGMRGGQPGLEHSEHASSYAPFTQMLETAYKHLGAFLQTVTPQTIVSPSTMQWCFTLPKAAWGSAQTTLNWLEGFPGFQVQRNFIDVQLFGVPPSLSDEALIAALQQQGILVREDTIRLQRTRNNPAFKQSKTVVSDQILLSASATNDLWFFITGEKHLIVNEVRIGIRPYLSREVYEKHELNIQLGSLQHRAQPADNNLCKLLAALCAVGWTEADICDYIALRVYQETGHRPVYVRFRSFTKPSPDSNDKVFIPIWDHRSDIFVAFPTAHVAEEALQALLQKPQTHLLPDGAPLPIALQWYVPRNRLGADRRDHNNNTIHTFQPAQTVRMVLPSNSFDIFDTLYETRFHSALQSILSQRFRQLGVTHVRLSPTICLFEFSTRELASAFVASTKSANHQSTSYGPFMLQDGKPIDQLTVHLTSTLEIDLLSNFTSVVAPTPAHKSPKQRQGNTTVSPETQVVPLQEVQGRVQALVKQMVATEIQQSVGNQLQELRTDFQNFSVKIAEQHQNVTDGLEEQKHRVDKMEAVMNAIPAMQTQLSKIDSILHLLEKQNPTSL